MRKRFFISLKRGDIRKEQGTVLCSSLARGEQ